MSKGDNNMEFTAEVNRLLQILTHSIYSNKEVFLRELISNASDACDKLRYISISQSDVAIDDLKIKITVDSNKKTISISDNGIGMTRDEMIENLGTIARSGTKTFIENMSKDDDTTSQIGQFGIGFYSAFIVSKDVTVLSKKFDSDEVHLWRSDGTGTYSVQKITDKNISGTEITIKLAKDAHEFADKQSVQDIVKKYSDNINFPIYLAENSAIDDEQINTAGAIWAKPKAEITAERAETIPQVFTKIHLHFILKGNDLEPSAIERAIKLSSTKYCSASIMLEKSVKITHDFKIVK